MSQTFAISHASHPIRKWFVVFLIEIFSLRDVLEIRAAMVRIMKFRKELSHTLLLNELHQQVKKHLIFICLYR